MKLYPAFCVESGNFFSFVRGKNERDAAQSFVFRIMRIKDAVLGETVVVREDYRRKKLATFNTEDLLSPFSDRPDLKFRKENGQIQFMRVPVSRSSRFESWQGVFRKGESMMRLKKCHWIARGLTKNPVNGEMP